MYAVFILMIIMCSIQFSQDSRVTFKTHVGPEVFDLYLKYKNNATCQCYFDFNDFSIRKHKPHILDVTITIWVIGMTLQEIKHVYLYGMRDYMRSWNNILNSLMNVLYFASYGVTYYTIFLVRNNMHKVINRI